MATTYGISAEFQALLASEIPSGAADKAFLYASGSGADTALYAKLGDDSQVSLLTSGFSLQDTANGGIADFTFDNSGNVTISVDPTNATAITTVADGDLLLVADADDSNNLKKITRANFIESAALDSINIDGGAIDGTPIGASAQSTAKFTTLSASSDLNVAGNAFVEGTLNVTGAAVFSGGSTFGGAVTATALSASGDLNVVGSAFVETNLNVTGAFTVAGNVTLGDAASDTVTVNADVASNLIPSADDTYDIGAVGSEWKDLYIDGVAYIDDLRADALGAALDANNQAITNINVDSGAIDGVTIGTNSAATQVVATQLTASNLQVNNNLVVVGDLQVQGNLDSVTVTQNTLEVTDKLIVAGASGSAASVDGGGLQIGGSELADDEAAAILWDNGNSALDFNIGTTTEVRLQDGVLRPERDDDVDLGASGAEFKDLYLDGIAYVDELRADQLGAALDANSQNISNVGALTATSLSASADLNVVGSAYVETNLNVTGNLVVNGNSTLGNASSDVVTVTGQLTASEGLLVSSGGDLDFAAAADINIVSGSASALEIKEGNNNYMAFITNQPAGGAISVGSNDVVSFFPQVDSNVDLGAASFAWKNLYVDAIDLNGQGSISMGGTGRIDLDADDDTSIRASSDDVITFEVAGVDEFQMSANMFGPASADGASLGGASNEWSDLYLADAGVIYFGADQDIMLSHDADQGLTLEQATDAAGEPILTLKTVGDLASGAELKFALDNGAGEADDDQLGAITFYGDDDGDTATKYAEIKVLAEDVTDTEEDGSITLSALVAGTMRDIMIIGDIPGNSAGVTLPNNSTYGTMKAHSFVTYSDENLKTNIQPVVNALDKVKSLQGVTYDWKSDGSSDIGFIAQEVEKVVPQIVKSNGSEGSYAMNYSRVTALLVEGIKEQQAQIENLKKALKSIKK